jgi:hypothetical protein
MGKRFQLFFHWLLYRPVSCPALIIAGKASRIGIIALITVCSLAVCYSSAPAIADSDTESWPDQLYFPQRPEKPLTAPAQKAPKKQTASQKSHWRFKRKGKADKNPLPTDAQMLNAGPRETQPSPYPLLRLPMPLQTGTGILAAGIYLVQPDNSKPDQAASQRTLVLVQRNEAVLKVPLTAYQGENENVALTGTASPLQTANPNLPVVIKVQARPSEDLKSVTLILKVGDRRFDSAPFPVATDQREILHF